MKTKTYAVTVGSRWLNRFTGEIFRIEATKGLYVTVKNETTGAVSEWHRGNVNSCNTLVKETK